MSASMSEDELIASDEMARAVIHRDLDRTLFVEAGAGTGKTTALVDRIVELVLDPRADQRVGLSQIAAITFTEAAAAELRERIRVKFESRLADARRDGHQEIVTRCEQALQDADIAAISTLHAFAQRLLSEFPVEVGLPPRVEVIDEVRSQIAFNARWSNFLDSLYDDPNLEEFVVRAAILSVKLDSVPMSDIAHNFEDNWDCLLNIDLTASPASPIDFSAVREQIHKVRSLPDQCSNEEDTLRNKIRAAESLFERFFRADSEYEQLRVTGLIQKHTFGARNGRIADWVDVDDARETCAALKDACTDLTSQVSAQTLAQLAKRIAEFARDAANDRRAEGLLEFHDLLVLAHLLLRNSAEARDALSERYRVVMLDEFQDTDPIQISLALLLASAVDGVFTGEWTELEPESGRVFMVGDPKQSIYRFRRADIKLFLKARDKFEDGRVGLQRNFRTVRPVIEAVNGLFGTLMPEDTEAQAKYAPLIATREGVDGVDHRPLVFGGGQKAPAREIREAEAADVASIISEIMNQPDRWPIEQDGRWRAPKLSDITILLPTRTSLSQLSNALDDKSIPFRADTGTLVYETQEIKDLLSALRAIDDTSDEVALVAALRSPLYACGYDDLAWFIDAGGRLDLTAHQPDAVAGSVVMEGIEHLAALAARRWWDEPSQLLLDLIEQRNAMALPAGERRARDVWRRLRYVVDQARAFAEAGGGDLREYLEWTSLQGAGGSRAHEPMLPEPDDDAVQVMTIHGSKGLEFPITIVSGLTTKLGNTRPGGTVIWEERDVMPEVRVSANARTSNFDSAKELDDEMEGPERDRLLYVALTRARDHLVVSAHHGLNAKGKPTLSHGAKVSEWAKDSGTELTRSIDDQQGSMFPPGRTDSETGSTPPLVLASMADWKTEHRSRLARGAQRSVISATALANTMNGQPGSASDAATAPTLQTNDFIELTDFDGGADVDEPVLPPRQFRRGRAGSAIGTAVHGVLQFVDLNNPDTSDIDSLSAAQAWAESIPEHLDTVRAAVTSALEAPIVASCRAEAGNARHWKELYVAAPVGDMTIEGYIDLLVETPDGLVVVDYKTDAVRNVAEIDAKLARYELQGAAYALAVERTTGQDVVDVRFVFARPEGAIERSVSDLDGAKSRVRAATSASS